jgi:hypothetical protein
MEGVGRNNTVVLFKVEKTCFLLSAAVPADPTEKEILTPASNASRTKGRIILHEAAPKYEC